MKKNEVKIGNTYRVKVTGKIAEVRITGENPNGGWDGVNVVTNRQVRIKSAKRLRSPVSRPAKRKKIVSLAEYEAEAKAEHKANVETKRDLPTGQASTGERGANAANTGDNPPRCKSILAAAVCILKACDRPLGCKEIVAKAMETDIWQPRNGGKTPANTLCSAILRETKNKGEEARFRKARLPDGQADRGKFELAK